MNIKKVAKAIEHKFDTDEEYAKSISKSMEFFRAAIYESGVVPNAKEIDGTDEWHKLVDELEVIFL